MKKMKKVAGVRRQKLGNGFGRKAGIPRPVKKTTSRGTSMSTSRNKGQRGTQMSTGKRKGRSTY